MRFRKSAVALTVAGVLGTVGLAASPASAHDVGNFCGHYDVVHGDWYIAYLRHSTTPYGVHYHYYRHSNVVTGADHRATSIC